MEKYIFYTSMEAFKAAKEARRDYKGSKIVDCVIDDRSGADAEESSEFREIVGNWSGEMNAFRVEDADGQIVAYFGYWERGSQQLRVYDTAKGDIYAYVTDDDYLIKMSAGWARYPRESFTFAQALINQWYLDDENPENDERYGDTCEVLTYLAKNMEMKSNY